MAQQRDLCKAQVWHDTTSDPANPGWVLRVRYAIGGDTQDEDFPLDATDEDDRYAALEEARQIVAGFGNPDGVEVEVTEQ